MTIVVTAATTPLETAITKSYVVVAAIICELV